MTPPTTGTTGTTEATAPTAASPGDDRAGAPTAAVVAALGLASAGTVVGLVRRRRRLAA